MKTHSMAVVNLSRLNREDGPGVNTRMAKEALLRSWALTWLSMGEIIEGLKLRSGIIRMHRDLLSTCSFPFLKHHIGSPLELLVNIVPLLS